MGTELVGEVQLENEERVYITWLVRPLVDATRAHITRLRSARILNRDGSQIGGDGMLSFGTEPNPDANDGTYIGTLLDVTRPR